MNEELLVDARMRTLCMLSGPTIHELRGAANVLALHLQLLSIEPTDDDAAVARRRRSLAAADDGRRRLFTIAETFVRLATVPDPVEREFDLGRVAADAVTLARPFGIQRRVELALDVPDAAAMVRGRRDVVAQTMVELLLGLVQRLPNGATLHVAVRAEPDDVRVVMTADAPDATPDPALVDRATGTMEWAGGSLQVDGARVDLRMPAAPPGATT